MYQVRKTIKPPALTCGDALLLPAEFEGSEKGRAVLHPGSARKNGATLALVDVDVKRIF